MSYILTITHPDHPDVRWSQTISQDELVKFADPEVVRLQGLNALREAPTAPFYKSLLVPIRTDGVKHFAVSLFIPALSSALEWNAGTCERVASVVIAIIIDLATIWIRLLTAIPRLCMNPGKEASLLYRYLQSRSPSDGINPQILESDKVELQLKYSRTVTGLGCTVTGPHIEARMVNFIELPEYPGSTDTILINENNTAGAIIEGGRFIKLSPVQSK